MSVFKVAFFTPMPILLMEESLYQLRLVVLYHYLQGFIHPRWLFGISVASTVVPDHLRMKMMNPSSSRASFVFCRPYGGFFKIKATCPNETDLHLSEFRERYIEQT